MTSTTTRIYICEWPQTGCRIVHFHIHRLDRALVFPHVPRFPAPFQIQSQFSYTLFVLSSCMNEMRMVHRMATTKWDSLHLFFVVWTGATTLLLPSITNQWTAILNLKLNHFLTQFTEFSNIVVVELNGVANGWPSRHIWFITIRIWCCAFV